MEMSKMSEYTLYDDKNNLIFKFGIVTKGVQVTLSYEDESDGFLAQSLFTNFNFSYNMYPTYFLINASLGNLIIYDGFIINLNIF